MSKRRIEVFFYGLFMDQKLLIDKGVHPTDIRSAVVDGFMLRIGSRAALVPSTGKRVHGMLMRLSHAEIESLYAEPGLQAYRPEPVLAVMYNGATVAALCFNLPDSPEPDERNAEYAEKLRALAERVGLPDHYIASIQ